MGLDVAAEAEMVTLARLSTVVGVRTRNFSTVPGVAVEATLSPADPNRATSDPAAAIPMVFDAARKSPLSVPESEVKLIPGALADPLLSSSGEETEVVKGLPLFLHRGKSPWPVADSAKNPALNPDERGTT